MKMEIVDPNFIKVEPLAIAKKSKLWLDPKAGLGSQVITYKVLDCNGELRFKDKILGIHKQNVHSYLCGSDTHYLCDKRIVVFIATAEKDEELLTLKDIEDRKLNIAKEELNKSSVTHKIIT